jgi:hypothetical protein
MSSFCVPTTLYAVGQYGAYVAVYMRAYGQIHYSFGENDYFTFTVFVLLGNYFQKIQRLSGWLVSLSLSYDPVQAHRPDTHNQSPELG